MSATNFSLFIYFTHVYLIKKLLRSRKGIKSKVFDEAKLGIPLNLTGGKMCAHQANIYEYGIYYELGEEPRP